MSVFDASAFADPPKQFRPLQIVHGLDHALTDPENLTGEEGIDRRLQQLVEMGTGGIVTNVGFKDYLVSARQWEILRYGLKKADDRGLVLWWYDEKGYPSGTAGGIVTRSHPEFVAIGLACYTTKISGPAEVRFDLPVSCRKFIWAGALAQPDTATVADAVDLGGQVDEWGTVRWNAPAGEWTLVYLAERVMYEGTHSCNNVSDFKHYINLLNPDATREFLRVTHEQYYREIPRELWSKIRAVFTDEPSFMTAYVGELPERFRDKIPVMDAPLFTDRPPALPWIEDLRQKFQALKGYDLTPHLFQLFYSEAGEACYARQDYYDVIVRLYTDAFYGQILRWCQAHGIRSSGHVLAEETILSHVEHHGSLFPPLRNMDLPGIDMLNSDPQDMLAGDSFMTIKQVTSVAHLTGAAQIHSESSDWVQGNSGRHASLAERMGQGNLQYVLGINQITSYFGWQELGTEAWRRYNDYMGRLASLLTGGSHVCDVAVLYPIRSMWAHYLPPAQPPHNWSDPERLRTEWMKQSHSYPDLVRTLLRNQVDLDIIDEEAIEAAELRDGKLCIGSEAYRAVVLPPLRALSLAAGQKLAAFAKAGVVLATGSLPDMAESAEKTPTLRAALAGVFGAGGPGGVVAAGEAPAELRRRLSPDFALEEADPDVLYTHRRLDGRALYFITNNSAAVKTLQPALGQAGPYTLYRPLTGATQALDGKLELCLEGYEGQFVVCG